MRKHTFEIGEYYHIYNRGSDKREIILDQYDLYRFVQSFTEFNTDKPIGSIYENSFRKKNNLLGSRTTKSERLVDIIAYCINPNHFHIILTPLVDKGIEKFMQRMGGYTRYFNEKYERNGVLFQGKFKSKHVGENRHLLHLSVYVNYNNRDLLGSPTTKLSCSSLEEYISPEKIKFSLCNQKIVLGQFKSKKDYETYGKATWKGIVERKEDLDPN